MSSGLWSNRFVLPRKLIPIGAIVSLGLTASTQECRTCHPAETAAFLNTAMGRSLGDPVQQPDGRFFHKLSNSTITIQHRAGTLEHRIEKDGLSATYAIAYAVGAGSVGYSYFTRIGTYLFQSPASFYRQAGKWDLTPGYESDHSLDFTHQVTSGCLFCHTGSVRLINGTDNQFGDPAFTPISCERCHGASENHLAHPGKNTIVNPAKLSPARRNAVCEQCHLEGETRILNPDRTWWDFKSGQELETVFVTYLQSGVSNRVRAVSQSELLAESGCEKASRDKLWCGTCHNPHAAAGSRAAQVRQICLNCHESLFTRAKHKPASECVTCHMPRLRPDDVAHAAVTDHRIPRIAGTQMIRQPTPLHAWREPDPSLAQRDLGLAYFELASTNRDPEDLKRAYDLLARVPPPRDASVLADLGSILLSQHFNDQALLLLQQACAAEPANARYAYVLGMAFERSGNSIAAEKQFRRSIQLDRSQPDPYLALASLYEKRNDIAQQRRILEEYLKFMPQNLGIRPQMNANERK